jgi:hypothetical protein
MYINKSYVQMMEQGKIEIDKMEKDFSSEQVSFFL